jgi:hypothetical protein
MTEVEPQVTTAVGWVVAAIVAVAAICAVAFMLSTRPSAAPDIVTATGPFPTLPGAAAPAAVQADIVRAEAEHAAAEAQGSAVAAQIRSADQAAADASAQAPAIPPDGDLRPAR